MRFSVLPLAAAALSEAVLFSGSRSVSSGVSGRAVTFQEPVTPAASLVWSYLEDRQFIAFNVWGTTNFWQTNVWPEFDPESIQSEDTNTWVFIGWQTNAVECWRGWVNIGTTTNMFFPVQLTGSFGFLTVTASNTVTGLESAR